MITALDLITELRKLPPDTLVYAYLDGDRYEVLEIDESFLDKNFVDINLGV